MTTRLAVKSLLVAALAAVCLWVHAAERVSPSLPPAASAEAKATANLATPKTCSAAPFAVVEAKRGDIQGDLAVADALGIKPVKITNPTSVDGIAPNGQAFKWVLTLEGELWGIPMLDRHLVFTEKDRDIIKHDIVTRGGPVRSAGKGIRRGDSLFIDSRSGHYHPSKQSVKELAYPAFKAVGFEKIEIRDNLLSD